MCALCLGLVATAAAPVAAGTGWTQVGTGITNGISGLAPASSGWLIVRDNKKAGQNRIALLADTGDVVPLDWPGTQPVDLEAVSAIPGSPGQFAALTSKGSGTVLSVTGTDVGIVERFVVPRGSANIEGLAIGQVEGTTVAAWATRGSPTAPAKVFASTFDPRDGSFGRVVRRLVTVPYPTSNVRHVSDLALVGTSLVGSSASDPGNNGPFDSALYRLGVVGVGSGKATLNFGAPESLGVHQGHKIEGIACSGSAGLLGTDDENQGSSIAPASFCG